MIKVYVYSKLHMQFLSKIYQSFSHTLQMRLVNIPSFFNASKSTWVDGNSLAISLHFYSEREKLT